MDSKGDVYMEETIQQSVKITVRKEVVMRKAASTIAVITVVLLSAIVAFAAPNVEIKIRAEKEKVVTKEGKKEKKMVIAKETAPCDIIHYTILYRNTGNEDATAAVISDPIPEGAIYIPGTATEIGELTFSIDGGKTFKKPSLLTYEIKGSDGKTQKRVASPEEYTHIRWVIDRIPAGTNGKVSFQVKVK